MTNYAACPHIDSEFCQLANNNFHVLLDSSIELGEAMKQIKCYAVACLFSTFKHLFSTSTKLQTNGDVFSKQRLAIENNNKAGKNFDSVKVHLRLPMFSSSAAQAKNNLTKAGVLKTFKNGGQKTIQNVISLSAIEQTQTVKLCTEEQVKKILCGPHSGAFCKLMLIFVSGCRNLDTDSEILFVCLVSYEKRKF